MQHVLDTQSVQGLGLSQGVIGGSLSSMHLKLKKEGIMHSKPCLMVHLESIDKPIGKRASKDIVSPGGLVGTMGPAGVVTGGTTPLVCLSSNINEGVVAQGLSEAGEGAWVTIEIPTVSTGPWGCKDTSPRMA